MKLRGQDRQEVEALMRQGIAVARASLQGAPLTKFWQKSATMNPGALDRFEQLREEGGLIARLGEGHSMLTISPKARLKELENVLGPLPTSVEVATPNGTRLIYFTSPPAVLSARFDDYTHLRGLGEAGAVPPSRARDMVPFRWTRPPSTTSIAPLPSTWVNEARRLAYSLALVA